jgi:hypothetical protein
MRHADVRREFRFERPCLVAQDVPPALEDARDGRIDLGAVCCVLCMGIGDWNHRHSLSEAHQ